MAGMLIPGSLAVYDSDCYVSSAVVYGQATGAYANDLQVLERAQD